MNEREAVAIAREYIVNVLADEGITNLGVEEIERDPSTQGWLVTVGFSRPWAPPPTRAREILESIGAYSTTRRSTKVIAISPTGDVLSMKSRPKEEVW